MNLHDLHDLPPTLNAKQVADLLDKGINQIYTLARDGELPVLRLGRTLRFPTARILALLGVEADSRAGPPGAEKPPGEEGSSRNVTRQDDDFEGDTTTGVTDRGGSR